MSDHEIQQLFDQYEQGVMSRRELAKALVLAAGGVAGLARLLDSGVVAAAGPGRKDLIQRIVNLTYTVEKKNATPTGRRKWPQSGTWVRVYPNSMTDIVGRQTFATEQEHYDWLFGSAVDQLPDISSTNKLPLPSAGDTEADHYRSIVDSAKVTDTKVYNNRRGNDAANPGADELQDVYHVLQAVINYELDQAKLYAMARYIAYIVNTGFISATHTEAQWKANAVTFLKCIKSQYWHTTGTYDTASDGVILGAAEFDPVYTLVKPDPTDCPSDGPQVVEEDTKGAEEAEMLNGDPPHQGESWY